MYITLLLLIIVLIILFRTVALDEWIIRKLKIKPKTSTSYKGINVVITGASGGIGATIAGQYASMGATLVLGARNVENLNQVKEECLKKGAEQCHVIYLDVSNEESCKTFISDTLQVLNNKEIHILILNAGIGMKKRFDESTNLEQHKKLMDVNFWGAVYPVHYALPSMKLSNPNTIINRPKIAVVSSLSGKYTPPLRTAYVSSKHAVNGFFHTLRIEMKGKIDVTVLCPPHVYTDFQANSFGAENGVVRERSKFISPEQFASIAIDSIELGIAEEMVTLKGKASRIIVPLLPTFLADKIISDTATSASSVVTTTSKNK
ncbi:short chain dehydrogenase/reductase family protein [Naegleria gruberi]|uniref:Short chain dehydrogenase/reductase family protein n=1 Tax=Naegleria gruberi TaxID=5762 RepID=D2UYU5_NAEGR|nr:short chain dehydrogenase/reductase family protein [Naegleria gruberi]EFC50028.1 short chain dehydrogenase/reductase family protein [Naegleria gruberi]|eukprot:XP_002682772.1 short chain dehydrogenase/reductase family protein [Naegleria gruberi strain NEG-M]